MNLSLGIVGLPNVGKSTLFNALTKQQIQALNYPFCTIDPNVGVVPVADERLYEIAEIAKPEKLTPAVVEFVDIAGLVKGASKGEGLGNKFLSHIKEVSAIVHLVRSFQNPNITHVENSIDPKRDIELINTELILKDLETVENKIKNLSGRVRANPKLRPASGFFEAFYKHLSDGGLGIDFASPKDEMIVSERREMFLLTDKPVIYLVNSHESDAAESQRLIQNLVGGKTVLTMDVKLESELAEMADDERGEFMKELGMKETGLEMLTREAYKLLGLISFFTEGPEEVRAWTIKAGSSAPEAGAAIHTDFKNKFIAADVCTHKDYLDLGGWNNCKNAGKVRLEGKDYIVKDGDIIVFRHGS